MQILTLLPAASVERVTLALGNAVLVETVSQPRQFLELAQLGIWRMLVIDPDLIALQEAPAFVDSIGCCAAPLIVYTSLTRASARTIAVLAKRSLAAVLLRGFDDSLASLRLTLDPGPLELLGGSMVELLAYELDELPPDVRRGTIAAFCASAPVNSPKALAVLSGQSRRSIDRWFTRVGLKPAKSVLATSQLIRAYSSLEDASLSLASVALISGFGSAKALNHNSLALTGIPVRALRKVFPPLGLIDRLGAELRSSTQCPKTA
jgi:AraC-like DNA-binding protein